MFILYDLSILKFVKVFFSRRRKVSKVKGSPKIHENYTSHYWTPKKKYHVSINGLYGYDVRELRLYLVPRYYFY